MYECEVALSFALAMAPNRIVENKAVHNGPSFGHGLSNPLALRFGRDSVHVFRHAL
jgi:hypothetical protein